LKVIARRRRNDVHLTYVCDTYINYRVNKLLKWANINKGDFTADQLDQMMGELEEAIFYDIPISIVIEIRLNEKSKKKEFLVKLDPLDSRSRINS